MPFDPALPQNNVQVLASVLRGQFNGLKEIIDAILTVTAAQVDGVATLPSGTAAAATVSVVGNTLHFTFGLPQGAQGEAGPQGQEGQAGPPFALAVVDAVNTLPAGSAATVDMTFDGTNVHFTFGIPQGNDGATGAAGPPGEVSLVDLDNGLANTLAQTSANTNAVSTLDNSYSDPETEELRNKVNELINAMRR